MSRETLPQLGLHPGSRAPAVAAGERGGTRSPAGAGNICVS